MKKEEKSLFERFMQLEEKLQAEIKKLPPQIEDCEDKKLLKKRIKDYILEINRLKKLLDEYEELACKLEKLTSDGEEEVLTHEIVDLRPESEADKKLKKQLEETENIVLNGKVVGVKKKKPINESREL